MNVSSHYNHVIQKIVQIFTYIQEFIISDVFIIKTYRIEFKKFMVSFDISAYYFQPFPRQNAQNKPFLLFQ
jgi:hypothetical protein